MGADSAPLGVSPVGALSNPAFVAETLPASAVHLRCLELGATTVTVPAVASAYVQSAGATRIQASYLRLTLLSGAPTGVLVGAGHAIRGYR